MKIAVLSNVIKSNPSEAAHAFLDVIGDKCDVFIAREMEGVIPAERYYDDDELFKNASVAVVFGGDGTTLTAARRVAPYNLPILSINTGHLGFLATVSAQDAEKAAQCLLGNTLSFSERLMLNVRVVRDGKTCFESSALNDVVIRRTKGKLANINVSYNASLASNYRADGVVVSTPTGSTAYSLSCGGPIVMPTLDLFVIAPICPHFLASRPMIVPGDGTLELSFSAECGSAEISADGQEDFRVVYGDKIIITKSPYKAKFLTLNEQNFFDLVRQKLTLD